MSDVSYDDFVEMLKNNHCMMIDDCGFIVYYYVRGGELYHSNSQLYTMKSELSLLSLYDYYSHSNDCVEIIQMSKRYK